MTDVESTDMGTDQEVEDTEATESSDDIEALKNEIEKWRTHARKHEKRAKENKEAADKLKEIEEQNKTDFQRLQERAESAEKELTDWKATALRERVARQHGLPDGLARRLQGDDEETLAHDAEELAKLIKPSSDTEESEETSEKDTEETSGNRRTQERLTHSDKPSNANGDNSPDALAARVRRK